MVEEKHLCNGDIQIRFAVLKYLKKLFCSTEVITQGCKIVVRFMRLEVVCCMNEKSIRLISMVVREIC